MSFPVTASPTEAFVDAVRALLVADVALDALVNGVFGHLSEADRTLYPYVVLGRRTRTNEAGAMQVAGSMTFLQIDVWHGINATATSNPKGPHTVHAILSRISVLLERLASLAVTGFTYIAGSLTCEYEEVTDEPDEDSPDRLLYHGIQRWVAEVHES